MSWPERDTPTRTKIYKKCLQVFVVLGKKNQWPPSGRILLNAAGTPVLVSVQLLTTPVSRVFNFSQVREERVGYLAAGVNVVGGLIIIVTRGYHFLDIYNGSGPHGAHHIYFVIYLFLPISLGEMLFPSFLREEFKDITSRTQGHVASKQHSQLKPQLIPRS